MNRVFHARITWYHLLFLVLVSVCTVFLVWHKQALGALLFSLVLLVLIECVIHTTYTVTAEGLLVIAKGRFYKKKNHSYRGDSFHRAQTFHDCVQLFGDSFCADSLGV